MGALGIYCASGTSATVFQGNTDATCRPLSGAAFIGKTSWAWGLDTLALPGLLTVATAVVLMYTRERLGLSKSHGGLIVE